MVDHPDLRNRILPRDLSVFAHTDPVYFLKDGHKVREEASIEYLCKYVEGTLHWLGTQSEVRQRGGPPRLPASPPKKP